MADSADPMRTLGCKDRATPMWLGSRGRLSYPRNPKATKKDILVLLACSSSSPRRPRLDRDEPRSDVNERATLIVSELETLGHAPDIVGDSGNGVQFRWHPFLALRGHAERDTVESLHEAGCSCTRRGPRLTGRVRNFAPSGNFEIIPMHAKRQRDRIVNRLSAVLIGGPFWPCGSKVLLPLSCRFC